MVYLSLFLTNVIFSGFGRAVFVFSLPTYIIPQSYKIVKFLGGVFVALCNEMCVMEMWNVMGFLGFYNGKHNTRNSSRARVCGEFFM
jgi:hypothetical protein